MCVETTSRSCQALQTFLHLPEDEQHPATIKRPLKQPIGVNEYTSRRHQNLAKGLEYCRQRRAKVLDYTKPERYPAIFVYAVPRLFHRATGDPIGLAAEDVPDRGPPNRLIVVEWVTEKGTPDAVHSQ